MLSFNQHEIIQGLNCSVLGFLSNKHSLLTEDDLVFYRLSKIAGKSMFKKKTGISDIKQLPEVRKSSFTL